MSLLRICQVVLVCIVYFSSTSVQQSSIIVFKDSEENVIPTVKPQTKNDTVSQNNSSTLKPIVVVVDMQQTAKEELIFNFKDYTCIYPNKGSSKKRKELAILMCDDVPCTLESNQWICQRDEASAGITCNLKVESKKALCWESLGVRNIFDAPTRRPICPGGQSLGHNNKCRTEVS